MIFILQKIAYQYFEIKGHEGKIKKEHVLGIFSRFYFEVYPFY